MTTRTAQLAAAGLALGAALTLLGSAGTAQAAGTRVTGTPTTVQAHSNIRDAPTTNSRLMGTTTRETEAGVECYQRGQRVTAGGYTTDVWYFGTVIDYDIGHIYSSAWVWGGNVNVGRDPGAGIPPC
ncbi:MULTISPECIES: hypothetical protein [unclassified Streptomyces]|uniref:hypothetical protein n=1 Tax=unclassified Streptomyces TaxID=2593676 RepID=UPI00331BE060